MKRVLITLLLAASTCASAGIYTWTDDSGTVNFAEDSSSVPKKYRKKMKLLNGDDPAPAAEDVSGSSAPAAKEQPQSPEAKSGDQEEKRNKGGKGASSGKRPKGTETYEGRPGTAWQAEFLDVTNRLTRKKEELGEKRNRLVSDATGLTREQYIELQAEVRKQETEYAAIYEEKQKLIREADKAGLPDDFRW